MQNSLDLKLIFNKIPTVNEMKQIHTNILLDTCSNFKELMEFIPQDLSDYIKTLKNVQQDPEWHPEGNVYNHIEIVVNKAFKYDIDLILAALFHDTAKDRTTYTDDEGRVRSPGHEEYSLEVVDMYEGWIKEMGADFGIVRNLVKYHMIIKFPNQMGRKLKSFLENSDFYDKLILFSKCDKMT